jgi:hypothetical protein
MVYLDNTWERHENKENEPSKNKENEPSKNKENEPSKTVYKKRMVEKRENKFCLLYKV